MTEKTKNFTPPILILLLVAVVAFLAGVFFARNLYPGTAPAGEKKAVEPTPTPVALLSVERLKNYASQIGLDTKKFNQCLDEGRQTQKVSEDTSLANSLGVGGTPAFFINGRFLGGAFPFDSFKEIIDKELAGKGSSSPNAYSQFLQDAAKPENGRPAAFNPKPVKVSVSENDPQTGPEGARVTVVEFSDFQCPYCVRAYSVVKQVMETYQDSLRLVFKQLPLIQLHPYAQKAAEASLCAQEQGKFWEYHDKVFGIESSGQ